MSKQCMDKKVRFQTLDTISQELRKNIWKLKKKTNTNLKTENEVSPLKFKQTGMRINKESYRKPKNGWEFSRRLKSQGNT